ncbi:hypothetical protein DAPPUDRAFT_307135 [Daphnia pulex]|uniref:Uncharacterized protein n=1 Tax=Daphnia pulex TaxID=6669 RepID=E9FZE8_DAPPU|nr:hypothetical protein DAPPUDRAFT_307135 [Daphnia pulex]|eukprot:EFX87040.1 hypothetical protein DAPPUDRAFT_307135 [Daphnia pulex]
MAAPNASDLFCKAVSEGSVLQLKILRQIHGRKAIMANFMDTPCNKQGDTCLKVAIESEFYDVLEFLVHQLKGHIMFGLYKIWKASIKNVSPFSWETYTFQEVTEPFVLSPDIAIIRDICHKVPITRLIEYLIDVGCDEPLWLEFVLNSILASSIPRPDKIVALECIGTAFIFKQTHYLFQRRNVLNEIRFWRGPRCWKEALILRNATADGEPAIPKVPCEQSEMLRNAFGDVAEMTTVEELEQLEQQWSLPRELEEWQILRQSLEAQALLVGHRTFTRQTDTGLNSFHLENLVLFSNNFNKQNSRAFNIYLIILDQSYGFTSTSPHKCVGHFVRTIYGLLILFDKLWANQQDHPETREIASKNLVLTVKYTLAALTNVSSASPHFRLIDRTWQQDIQKKIHVLLSNWLSSLTKEHTENLKECLVPFFRIYNSNHGFLSLLHMVVNFDRPSTYMTTYSTTVQLIQLMLEAGADPRITDRNGKTPFHCLFDGSVWTCARSNLKTVFKAMLDAGGHLDQATSSGRTVISLIKSWRTSALPFANLVRDPYFDSFIYSVLPLSCSCAQVIRQKRIPFENQLPPSLKSFVLLHSDIKIT